MSSHCRYKVTSQVLCLFGVNRLHATSEGHSTCRHETAWWTELEDGAPGHQSSGLWVHLKTTQDCGKLLLKACKSPIFLLVFPPKSPTFVLFVFLKKMTLFFSYLCLHGSAWNLLYVPVLSWYHNETSTGIICTSGLQQQIITLSLQSQFQHTAGLWH